MADSYAMTYQQPSQISGASLRQEQPTALRDRLSETLKALGQAHEQVSAIQQALGLSDPSATGGADKLIEAPGVNSLVMNLRSASLALVDRLNRIAVTL